MPQITQVSSTRGLNLPADVGEPDWIVQVGPGDFFVMEDGKGRVFVKKAQRWYKMTEFKPKEPEPVTPPTGGSTDPATTPPETEADPEATP